MNKVSKKGGIRYLKPVHSVYLTTCISSFFDWVSAETSWVIFSLTNNW